MAAVRHRIEDLGAAVLGVGPAAPHQAQRLQPRLGFPLLLDPAESTWEVLGLQRQSRFAYFANTAGWVRYLRALLRHRRQGRITGRPHTLPAVAIVSADRQVVWLHQGRSIADYPPAAQVVARLREHHDPPGG